MSGHVESTVKAELGKVHVGNDRVHSVWLEH